MNEDHTRLILGAVRMEGALVYKPFYTDEPCIYCLLGFCDELVENGGTVTVQEWWQNPDA